MQLVWFCSRKESIFRFPLLMEEDMSISEVVDLCSDGEGEDSDVKIIGSSSRKKLSTNDMKCESSSSVKGSTDVGSVVSAKTVQNASRLAADQGLPIEDISLMAGPPGFEKPICREFSKAGVDPIDVLTNGRKHLYVHPNFVHSNATSHKWVFGAVAVLLDKAVYEIQNGATFVIVDKITNPQNGAPALLIQDNGGGMDPGALRHCVNSGFSEKFPKSSIGQYGNGFKTSTMRIAAGAIVFTRTCKRVRTQSAALLSYTLLMATGFNNIIVPMVDYEFNSAMGKFQSLCHAGKDSYDSNLSTILQYSPFTSEAELLQQVRSRTSLGDHGTKVILYNLWFNRDGGLELDFESDAGDILISGAPKIIESTNLSEMLHQQHYAIRFRYSLRVYAAILYLRLPETFKIILRGHVVEHHHIVDDLKFYEYILYKPKDAGKEVNIVTTVGFIKEAPNVNIRGFNVYHKNRLILPFWQVNRSSNAKGQGVVGVLEANCIEPTHDKQDFEKCILYQKLETRLNLMTLEYWDYHCHLIGYSQVQRFPSSLIHSDDHLLLNNNKHDPPAAGLVSSDPIGACSTFWEGIQKVSAFCTPDSQKTSSVDICVSCQGLKSMIGSQSGIDGKRKRLEPVETVQSMKRQAVVGENSEFLETDVVFQHNTENQVADAFVIEVD